jgi:cysteine-rich repeat protein
MHRYVWILVAPTLACGDSGTVDTGTAETSTVDASSGLPTTTASTTDATSGPPTSGEPDSTTASLACVAPVECLVDVPECRTADCVDGTCVFQDMPEGTLLSDQIAGDCGAVACDGAGGTTVLPDPDDPEDDGVLCTLDTCDGTTPVHTPGMTACYTGDPETDGVGPCAPGVQACDDGGTPVGPCMGEVLPADEDCDPDHVDEDCDGQTNEEGLACVCAPDEQSACYTGEGGTQDVGPCHGGTAVCALDGLGFGPCEGEVTPDAEDCEPGLVDEDCDGQVNEDGAACVCGDGFVSAGEACDDGNTDDDDACSADCKQALAVLAVGTAAHHTCVRVTGGRVKCWGNNSSGELGRGDTEHRGDDPGEMGQALPYVDVGAGLVVVDITVANAGVCARFTDNRVKCWGSGGYLGLGDTENRGDDPGEMGDALPFLDFGAGRHAIDVQGTGYTYCALLDNARLKCWGGGSFGLLAIGNTQEDFGDEPGEMGDALPYLDLGPGVTVAGASLGEAVACALLTGGAVKCWGINDFGQLGLGDTDTRGDDPGEMGNALPAVPLGSGTVASVHTDRTFTCARFVDDSVRCWGNGMGLGIGDPDHHIGDQPNEMGANLPTVDLGGPASDLIVGSPYACARMVDDTIKCWGNGFRGCLGNGSENHLGDDPGEMGANLPVVDLGTGRKVVAYNSHYFSSCAILDDGSLKCWGDNLYGRLGLGDKDHRGDEPGEMGDNLPAVQVF